MTKINNLNVVDSLSPTDKLVVWRGSTQAITARNVAEYISSIVPNLQTVKTYADLTAISSTNRANNDLVYVASRTTDGDGGEGWWRFDAFASDTANGGTILAPDVGSGRWFRQYSGYINVRWFGAGGVGLPGDAAAISAAAAVAGQNGFIFVPEGVYIVEAITGLASGQRWLGSGRSVLRVASSASSATLLFAMSSLNDVRFSGFVFDGNTNAISTMNLLIRADNCTFIDFDDCEWKDTRGIGVFFGDCDDCGVRNSRFNNVGAYNLVSGLLANRRQAIAFSGTSGPYARPYALNNVFNVVGLDCISIGKGTSDGATEIRVIGNAIATNYAGSIFLSHCQSGVCADNVVNNGSAGGNGIDCFTSNYLNIVGNNCNGCGAAGILIANCTFMNVVSNKCFNNWQSGSTGAPSAHRGGISLTSASSGTVKSINISANQCHDTQGPGNVTQRFAIGVYTPAAANYFTIRIDNSNQLVGYDANGDEDFNSAVQTPDKIGIIEYPIVINLAASAEIVLYTANGYGELTIFQTSNSAYGRFAARKDLAPLELQDTATFYETTDTGVTNAVYRDAGTNTVRLKNRQAVTRTYVITAANWVNS